MTNIAAQASTVAALALHQHTFNDKKDSKLLRWFLEQLAEGLTVRDDELQELLAEWNAIDVLRAREDERAARLVFLRAKKVTSFELWLPPQPDALPVSIRAKINAITKGARYTKHPGSSDTRFVDLPNTQEGRAVADLILARGQVKLVIPRGRTAFHHFTGPITRPAEKFRRARTGPVTLTAREIERSCYARLRRQSK